MHKIFTATKLAETIMLNNACINNGWTNNWILRGYHVYKEIHVCTSLTGKTLAHTLQVPQSENAMDWYVVTLTKNKVIVTESSHWSAINSLVSNTCICLTW